MHYDVLIIGGGASGMMAALSALENPNNTVTLLERQSRVGKKLLATGNDDRNRTSCGDLFEILAVIALNQLSAQLGDNASGQREELGIAGHLFSDSHNAQRRDAVTHARVDTRFAMELFSSGVPRKV